MRGYNATGCGWRSSGNVHEHLPCTQNNHLSAKRRFFGHEERWWQGASCASGVRLGRGDLRFSRHRTHRNRLPRGRPVGRFDLGLWLLSIQRIAQPKQLRYLANSAHRCVKSSFHLVEAVKKISLVHLKTCKKISLVSVESSFWNKHSVGCR